MIYLINFLNQARLLMPTFLRRQKLLAYLRALLHPLQQLHNRAIMVYRIGSSEADYNDLEEYFLGQQVVFEGAVYEFNQDEPAIGEVPGTSPMWTKIADDYRGAYERVNYSAQRLVLEYMLNRAFRTSFVQPPFLPTRSDIYIDSVNSNLQNFWIGINEGESGNIPLEESEQENFIQLENEVIPSNFIVYYKASQINTPEKLEKLKGLTNRYKLYGSSPSYQSY